MNFKRVIFYILDGVGVGELPDAADYQDAGANTLGNLSQAVDSLHLPTLEKLGLGKLTDIQGLSAQLPALGAFGKCAEKSKGKDSTTGHWELMGITTTSPAPTYPNGFPDEIIVELEKSIGRKVLFNNVASGTEIIAKLGDEHLRSGSPIVYTSADSVFQIAAHEETIPIKELYQICEKARTLLSGPHAVSRVIARPFTGTSGHYTRTSHRHDFSLKPPEHTVLDHLKHSKVPVIGIGKIYDLFGGCGLTQTLKTNGNPDGMAKSLDVLHTVDFGLIFTNLVEFDQTWGHRNDCEGFYEGLKATDHFLGKLLPQLVDTDLLIISADHGVDPTTSSTDHSREYVPVLVYSPAINANTNIGTRQSFADIGATIAEIFEVKSPSGTSFLKEILP